MRNSKKFYSVFIFILILSLSTAQAKSNNLTTQMNSGNHDFLNSTTFSNGDSVKLELVGRYLSAQGKCLVKDGNYLYFGLGRYRYTYSSYAPVFGGILVFDISIPSNPKHIETIELQAPVCCMELNADIIYVGTEGSGLFVIDKSNPFNLKIVGSYVPHKRYPTQSVYVHGTERQNNFLYLALGNFGIYKLDISNPIVPVKVDSIDTDGYTSDVLLHDKYLFVADGNEGVHAINITDSTLMFIEGSYNTQDYSYDIEISGNNAYVADDENGLRILNISNPKFMSEIGYYKPNSEIEKIIVKDNIVLCGNIINGNDTWSGSGIIKLIDVSFPFDVKEIGEIRLESDLSDMFIINNSLYASTYDGFEILNISDLSNVQQTLSFESNIYYENIEIEGNIACIGYSKNIYFLDISNLNDPLFISKVALDGYRASCTDMSLKDNYLFVAASDGGLIVLDLTNINSPQQVTRISGYDYVGICIYENYVYIASNSDLIVYNISNPISPIKIKTIDIAYGRQMIVSGNTLFVIVSTGLWALNITDPASPQKISYIGIQGTANSLSISKDLACIGNSHYQNYGVHLIDISNPAGMYQSNFHSSEGSIRSVAISGNFLYFAHSNGEYGDILKASEILNKTSVEDHFDFRSRFSFGELAINQEKKLFALNMLDGIYIFNNPLDTIEVTPKPIFYVSNNTYDFGNVKVGNVKKDSIFVLNNGTAELNISSVNLDNTNEFAVAPTNATIAPSSSYKFYLSFKPEGCGTKEAHLAFNHNAETSPDTIILKGIGLAPVFTVSSHLVDFGVVSKGQSNYDSVVVNNNGNDFLEIYSVISTNSLFSVSPIYSTIKTDDSLAFIITLDTDTTLGEYKSSIIFTHNGLTSPDTVLATAKIIETDVQQPDFALAPTKYMLYNNFPNPFNMSTNIQFALPENQFVTVKVFDITGREVAVLINEEKSVGQYILHFNATKFPSGIYFYTLTAGNFSKTLKMLLLK